MRYIEGVATLRLDRARCNGCGLCVTVCPQVVFAFDDKRSRLVDPELAWNAEPAPVTASPERSACAPVSDAQPESAPGY